MIGMDTRDRRLVAMRTGLGRYAGVLWRNGFVSMEQVRAYPPDELRTLHGIGTVKAAAIRSLLDRGCAWGAIIERGGP